MTEMGRSDGAVYEDMDMEWKDRGESGGGVRGGKSGVAGLGWRYVLMLVVGLLAGKTTVEIGGR